MKNTKYKFITISMVMGALWNNKPLYKVINNATSMHLANIFYHGSWKQYAFMTNAECVFDVDSLRDVIDFSEKVNKELGETP